jgi:hypothetical protein
VLFKASVQVVVDASKLLPRLEVEQLSAGSLQGVAIRLVALRVLKLLCDLLAERPELVCLHRVHAGKRHVIFVILYFLHDLLFCHHLLRPPVVEAGAHVVSDVFDNDLASARWRRLAWLVANMDRRDNSGEGARALVI